MGITLNYVLMTSSGSLRERRDPPVLNRNTCTLLACNRVEVQFLLLQRRYLRNGQLQGYYYIRKV